jgi:hypothetical protein
MKGGRAALLAVPVAVLVFAGWLLLRDDGEWGDGADDTEAGTVAGTDELPAPAPFEAPTATPERLTDDEAGAEPIAEPIEVDLGPPDLAGLVVRRAPGPPRPAGVVKALGADGDIDAATTFSDVDGRFELRFKDIEPHSLMTSWYRDVEVSHTSSVEYGSDGKPTGPPETETTLKITAGDMPVRTGLALAPRDLGRDDLLIEVDTGWNLTGYVGDDAANPVQDALVVVGPSDGPRARTGSDGRFILRDMPRSEEPTRVTASHDGYVAHELRIDSPPEHDWTQDVTFSLAEGGTLVGFVRASTGEALPRAWVTVVVTDLDGGSPQEFPGLSRENGEYLVDGIPAGIWNVHVLWDITRVSRRIPGAPEHLAPIPHSVYVSGIRIRRGQQTEHDFELFVGATLSGVVEEVGGSPLTSHTVEIWHELDAGNATPLLNLEAKQVTDREGRFHFTSLYPGAKHVRVIGPDEGDVHHDPIASISKLEYADDLDLPRTGLVDVVLIVGGAGDGWIRGRVVDAKGIPLAGTVVQDLASDPDRRFIRALVEQDGSFAFRMAVERDTGIVFVQPGYLPKPVILQPSEDEIDLGSVVMDTAPGVVGLVVDAGSSEPVPGFRAIFSFDRGGRDRRMMAIGTGFGETFLVNRVAVGRKGELIEVQSQPGTFQFWGDRPFGGFSLTISASGYADWSHTGQLEANTPPKQFLVELQRD